MLEVPSPRTQRLFDSAQNVVRNRAIMVGRVIVEAVHVVGSCTDISEFDSLVYFRMRLREAISSRHLSLQRSLQSGEEMVSEELILEKKKRGVEGVQTYRSQLSELQCCVCESRSVVAFCVIVLKNFYLKMLPVAMAVMVDEASLQSEKFFFGS